MARIEIERLKEDREYWEKMAPEGAVFYAIFQEGATWWKTDDAGFLHQWHYRFSEWRMDTTRTPVQLIQKPHGPEVCPDEAVPNDGFLPRIVCSAVRFDSGPMLIGARHFDQHMCIQAESFGIEGCEPHTQGFVDQFGNFYDRETAWEIAERQGQIRRDVSAPGVLFSENLY